MVLTVEGLLPGKIHKLIIASEKIRLRPNDHRSLPIGQKGHRITICCTNISAYVIFIVRMLIFLVGMAFAGITCNVKHIRYWMYTYNPFEKRKKILESCKDVATLVNNKCIPEDKVCRSYMMYKDNVVRTIIMWDCTLMHF